MLTGRVREVYTRQSAMTESDLTSKSDAAKSTQLPVQRLDRLSRRVSQCAGIPGEFRRAARRKSYAVFSMTWRPMDCSPRCVRSPSLPQFRV